MFSRYFGQREITGKTQQAASGKVLDVIEYRKRRQIAKHDTPKQMNRIPKPGSMEWTNWSAHRVRPQEDPTLTAEQKVEFAKVMGDLEDLFLQRVDPYRAKRTHPHRYGLDSGKSVPHIAGTLAKPPGKHLDRLWAPHLGTDDYQKYMPKIREFAEMIWADRQAAYDSGAAEGPPTKKSK